MGLEALIRIEGHAAADTALAQAHEQESLPLLGSWVLEQACRNWLALDAAHAAPPHVAVNVAAAELEGRDYASTTLRLLGELGMPCRALQLEVAEDDLADLPDGSTLLQNLGSLRRHGVRIALDRFGRHQAALGKLASLPVDVIKIDVRHVRELRTQPQARAFLASVIGYAAALGHETILCGVENAADLRNLGALAPARVQGFGLALPQADGAAQACLLPC